MMDKNFIKLEDQTENTYTFAFFDVAENYYRSIFAKRGLFALITTVYTRVDCEYKLIICDVQKKDAITFCMAMNDLADEIDRHGYYDYLWYTEKFFDTAAKIKIAGDDS